MTDGRREMIYLDEPPVQTPLMQQLASLAMLDDRLSKALPDDDIFSRAIRENVDLMLQGVIGLLYLSVQAAELGADDASD